MSIRGRTVYHTRHSTPGASIDIETVVAFVDASIGDAINPAIEGAAPFVETPRIFSGGLKRPLLLAA